MLDERERPYYEHRLRREGDGVDALRLLEPSIPSASDGDLHLRRSM
jgi:hypothetical protein